MSVLCRMGWHRYPRFVNAYTQAPAPVRCERCDAAQAILNRTTEASS